LQLARMPVAHARIFAMKTRATIRQASNKKMPLRQATNGAPNQAMDGDSDAIQGAITTLLASAGICL
jgi:hypothetical protein